VAYVIFSVNGELSELTTGDDNSVGNIE